MLGNYLKNYRLKNNLTQAQMAERLGTSQSYYSGLETGRKKPGFGMVDKISKALNLKSSTIRKML